MATPFSIFARAGIFFGALTLAHSAAAQTAHCFNSLSGPEVPCTARGGGGGGGYAAPVYRGPSAAELARRRRIKAGNAANDRGAAARKRGDLNAAVRYFEEAARLWPEDRKVQGNYWNAKGELAERNGNYAEAASDYQSALRYYPGHAEITKRLNSAQMLADADQSDRLRDIGQWGEALSYLDKALAHCKRSAATWFCSTIELNRGYIAAGQALSHQEWAKAGEALRAYISAKVASPANANMKKEEKDFFAFEHSAADAIGRGNVKEAIDNYENMAALEKKWAAEQGKNPPDADVMLVELRRQAALQAKNQSQQEERERASNPNYPNPPPVYRDANMVRDYPDFTSFTPAQHSAHGDNDLGNVWAKQGNWVQAMLSYQKALVEDPEGPFAKVIKENLDIAEKHVRGAVPDAKPVAVSPPASPQKTQEVPKEVSASNCTGWMSANGKNSRLCMDAQAHRYCEEADGKGAISRVSCQ